MTRILADLPDEDIKWLDDLASDQGKSRAAVLREAVASFRTHARAGKKDWIARGAGYWSGRKDIGDAVEFQQAMRDGRTRYEDL